MTSNHATWRAVAIELQGAAEKLWPEIEGAFRAVGHGEGSDALREGLRYRGPFYLLAALAVENYAKALFVKQMSRRNESVTERDILMLGRGTHLVRMTKDAGLHLTSEEEALLTRLTQTMRWRGRYPAPVAPKAAAPNSRAIAGTADLGVMRSVVAKFEEAYQRIGE